MSAHGEGFYQAGIRCDHAGCQASIFRIGPSLASATTIVLGDAAKHGWKLAPDRSCSDRDLCPEHAKARDSELVREVMEADRR